MEPELYAYFELIWSITKRHMVPNLPSQFVFYLICCFEKTCPHPVCQKGPPAAPYRWYPNGPLITELPLPIPDPERP